MLIAEGKFIIGREELLDPVFEDSGMESCGGKHEFPLNGKILAGPVACCYLGKFWLQRSVFLCSRDVKRCGHRPRTVPYAVTRAGFLSGQVGMINGRL